MKILLECVQKKIEGKGHRVKRGNPSERVKNTRDNKQVKIMDKKHKSVTQRKCSQGVILKDSKHVAILLAIFNRKRKLLINKKKEIIAEPKYFHKV